MKNILIFGGSGFLGQSITKALLKVGYNVTVVCQDIKAAEKKLGKCHNLTIDSFDIFNAIERQKCLKNKDVIINLIGKLFEKRKGDFIKFHTHFPNLLVKDMTNNQHFIHVSALGIENAQKTSLYAKTKYESEKAIINSCQNYNIIKPSIIFGPADSFFNLFAKIAKFTPFLPLVGGGSTKFSPVYVEDITKSILVLIEGRKAHINQIFEACGTETVTFKDLMLFILKILCIKRFLIPLPFNVAKIQAKLMNTIKIFLLTQDQVELLKYDNIATNKYENITTLVSELQSYKKIVPIYIRN